MLINFSEKVNCKIKNSFVCFIVYWLIKPFYFFNSGSLQISDLFLLLSFVSTLIENRKNNIKNIFSNKDYLLLVFIFCVMFINIFYSLSLSSNEFIKPILYYVFNFFLVLTFRNLMRDKTFLNFFLNICKINLLLQLLFCVIGFGEYYSIGRYMGTYNDPNQFAFASMSTFFIIEIISFFLNKKSSIIYLVLSLVLIYLSASTGMLLGMGAYLFIRIFISAFSNIKNFKSLMARIFIACCFFLVFIVVFFFPPNFITENFLYQRIMTKISFDRNGITNYIIELLSDRNSMKVFIYGWTNLYGAGEGAYYRFANLYDITLGEIHSTWLSILFYYGIVPYIIFLIWVINNLKNANIRLVAVYIAMFIEGLTLLNQRQPAFWILIIISCLFSKKIDLHSDVTRKMVK